MKLGELSSLIPQGVNDGLFDGKRIPITSAEVDISFLFNNGITQYIFSEHLTQNKDNPFGYGGFKNGVKGELIYKEDRDYTYIQIRSLEDIEKHGFIVGNRFHKTTELYLDDPVHQHQLYLCPKRHSLHVGMFLIEFARLQDYRPEKDILRVDILNEWSKEHNELGFYYCKPFRNGYLVMEKNESRNLWIAHYSSNNTHEELPVVGQEDVNKLANHIVKKYEDVPTI